MRMRVLIEMIKLDLSRLRLRIETPMFLEITLNVKVFDVLSGLD